jgi:hypothetical protein
MWEVSYANLLMYMASIPSYKKDDDEIGPEEMEFNDLFNMMNHGNTQGK